MVLQKIFVLLLMVASISSDLSQRVRHFEKLSSSDLSHKIVKRGADPGGTHKHNKIREVGFRTLGRDFRLILSPHKGLLHPNFKVKESLFLFLSYPDTHWDFIFQAVEVDEDSAQNVSRTKNIPIGNYQFYFSLNQQTSGIILREIS